MKRLVTVVMLVLVLVFLLLFVNFYIQDSLLSRNAGISGNVISEGVADSSDEVDDEVVQNFDKDPVQTASVEIKHFKFVPDSLTIKKGQTVVWVNHDDLQYVLIADFGWEFSSPISPGTSYEYTFDEPGVYGYRANVNPSVRGKIIVTD